ncbi:aminotransferase class IV [Pseudorhodoferax sp. Leaf267]|uniref:aminotransferase class IV n=1 Tax=Pseudorhodoferax sp. Leaf267 TaxID=1736316 RepID=UPI0006F7FE4F|nr:aminotransferase class IV [Pseudorhodoferax sp. Leaf267]KQP21659.1 cytochrome C [Pseudorhodoferax sp. Leaf267]
MPIVADPFDPLPATLCHLDGALLPLREAKVSVLDRGFIFGDGVYEVVPVYAGRLFGFDAHMARLDRSLAEVRIPNPHTARGWRAIAEQLLNAAEPAAQHGLYLQVTRGVAMREHTMPSGLRPTVFAMLNPMKPVSEAVRAQGVACVSAEDFRWKKAHIKSTSLLGAVLSRQISADVGATETVMFRDGFLSEASASNVWVVKDGQLAGATPDELVLRGIRYGVIEQLCMDAGIGFTLRGITRDEVSAADELLLSSASKEVLPVATLDGQPIGNGRPGPIYERLYALYQQAKQKGRD